MSIQHKLVLIIAIFTLFIVATVATSFHMIDGKIHDSSIVSVAARQLLLITKIENETRTLITLLESESSADQSRYKLKELIELFNKNFNTLEREGSTQGIGKNFMLLPPNKEFEQQFAKVRKLWTVASQAFEVILNPQIQITSDFFYDAMNDLNHSWQPIFNESDQSVILLEQRFHQRIDYFKKFLLITFVLTLFMALFLLFFSKKYIIVPIQLMLKNLHELSQSENIDFNQVLPDFGRDEMGKIAKYINKMRTNIYQVRQTLQASNQEALRINQALENAATSVLISDIDYHIIYVNQSARKLFEHIQPYLQENVPQLKVANLLGTPIDVLPTHSRKLLEQLTHTHVTCLNAEHWIIEVSITPITNAQGERLGWVTELHDRTVEVTTEQEIHTVMSAAVQGDFNQRIYLENKTGFFKGVSKVVNQILDNNQKIIEELMCVFSAVAQGNLNQTMTKDYQGSLENLKNDVNTTIHTLTQVLAVIMETAEAINNVAEEISEGNANLSERTEQQAASLEETTANMEQMTGMVQQTTEYTKQATHLAMRARECAQQGGQVVGTAIEAMSEITRSSIQIFDIIDIINNLSFQTNLLALNAAVEAARAGEQGRGFAVVAVEVRRLAQRSTEAAKQIKNLIQTSVNKVEEGTRLVNQSGNNLEEIIRAVNEVFEIIVEIASNSQEQAIDIKQINDVVVQMNDITQQNAALVEEIASSSEYMKEQAHRLREHIAFFQTVKNGNSTKVH